MRWQLLRPSRQSVRVALWLGGVGALLLALLLRNPLFLIWRPYATPFVFAGPVAVLAGGGWRWRASERQPSLALLGLWLAVLVIAASQYGVFAWRKHEVLTAPDAEARRLGSHMIVGYTDPGMVEMLAGKGLIGGVFVSSHNVRGRSPAAIRAQIDAWQAARRSAGLPPLIVSTDQEGGIVSRMSPPLSPMPSLAEVIANAPDDEIDLLAFAYGERHGRELAALGINVNFAPLADLSTATTRHRFDFRSLIGRRAIDTDPGRVTPAVIGYAHGLEAHGVRATLKHFPGLGRVDADTHIVPATLAASERDLDARDWVPFRAGLSATRSLLMVGHATLPAIDAARPASRSAKVIDGVVRRRWGHDGVLVTDDLTMGAIVRQGLCSAGVDAINAGIDLLLVSYDADQYYEIFHCLLQASRAGRLASGRLAASDRRLNALHASFRHAPGIAEPIRAETPTAPRAGRNPAFSLVCASGCGIIPGLPARASPLPDG